MTEPTISDKVASALDSAADGFDSLSQKIDDHLVHNKEDVYSRHARKKKREEALGSGIERIAIVWLPGVFTYKEIKKGYGSCNSFGTRAALCSSALAAEVILNGMRFGAIYGLYRWDLFLESLM